LPNESRKLGPQSTSGSINSAHVAGDGKVLTGESAGDKIDPLKLASINCSDVSIPFNPRPVLGQHAVAERVNLDLPTAFQSRPL
jgi:hypothetical protein